MEFPNLSSFQTILSYWNVWYNILLQTQEHDHLRNLYQNILLLVLGLEWNMISVLLGLLGLGLEFSVIFHFLKHTSTL